MHMINLKYMPNDEVIDKATGEAGSVRTILISTKYGEIDIEYGVRIKPGEPDMRFLVVTEDGLCDPAAPAG